MLHNDDIILFMILLTELVTALRSGAFYNNVNTYIKHGMRITIYHCLVIVCDVTRGVWPSVQEHML